MVRRQEDGAGLQLVEVQAREEVEKQGRMSALTLQLANLTAGTLGSSWRGSDSIEPTSPLEEPDDDSGDEPLLSGFGTGVGEGSSELDPWEPQTQAAPHAARGRGDLHGLGEVRRWPAGSL